MKPHGITYINNFKFLWKIIWQFQHTVTKRREIETIERINNTYTTKLGQPTSRLEQAGSPLLTAIWSPYRERVLGCKSTPRVRPHIAVSGALAYNPRLQTGIINSLHIEMQFCFYFPLFTMLFHLVSHRILLDPEGLARPPGAQEFQDPLLYLKCCLTCCACRQAWNLGSVQADRKQVRGLLFCFWSLNKTSSLLISLTTLQWFKIVIDCYITIFIFDCTGSSLLRMCFL